MKTVLKSFIYSFYFARVSLKNYLPLIMYLVISQIIIIVTQNILLALVFFMFYYLKNTKIAKNNQIPVLNVLRNILGGINKSRIKDEEANDPTIVLGAQSTGSAILPHPFFVFTTDPIVKTRKQLWDHPPASSDCFFFVPGCFFCCFYCL